MRRITQATSDNRHGVIHCHAEGVAKQAMLAHYTEGKEKDYHDKNMQAELEELLVELHRNGLLKLIMDRRIG